MTTYFKEDYVHISYETDKSLGMAVWNGFLNSEEFRRASNACLQVIEEQKLLYWLGDNRKMKAIRQHDQEWFAQQALPRLAKLTLRKMATLVSEDIFNQMAVASLQSKANAVVNFDIFYFKTKEDALAWLTDTAIEKQDSDLK